MGLGTPFRLQCAALLGAGQALAIVAPGIHMDPAFMYSSDCNANAHLAVRIQGCAEHS